MTRDHVVPPVAPVSAEVILRSQGGGSLTTPGAVVTAENIEDYTPAPATAAKAQRLLTALGFEVMTGGISLTITAPAERFEQVFGVVLKFRKHPQTGEPIASVDRPLVVPDQLRDTVEMVVFPEPPEFFP